MSFEMYLYFFTLTVQHQPLLDSHAFYGVGLPQDCELGFVKPHCYKTINASIKAEHLSVQSA